MSSEQDHSASYLRHHRSIENTFEHHSQRNMITISFTSSNDETRTISSPPNGAPIIIGRASNLKSLPLPHPNHPSSHNLIFNCPVMSKTHAELSWVQHQPFIKDTGSTHGTWIKSNGSLLRLKPDCPHKLESGMAIRFGKIIGTGPQNDRERHYPIELTVKISKPSGTYGLTDQLLTSSDELSENEVEEQDDEEKEDDDEEEEEQSALVDPQIGSHEELALRRQYLTHDHSGSGHSHSNGEEDVSDEEEENSQDEGEEEDEEVEEAEDDEEEERHAEDSMISNPMSEHSTEDHMATLAGDAQEDTDQSSSVNEHKLLMDESISIADDSVDIDSSKSDSDGIHRNSNILSVIDHEEDIETDTSNSGIEVTAVQGLRSDPHALSADDQSIVISESKKIEETRLKQPPSSSAQAKSTDLSGRSDLLNVCSEPPSTSPTDSNESNAISQQAERTLPHSPRPIIPIRRMLRAEDQLVNPRSLEEHSTISTGIQTDLMANGPVESKTAPDDVLRPRIRYQSDGTFTTFAVDYHVAPVRCKRGREEEKGFMKISEESEEKSDEEEVEIDEEDEVKVEEDHVPKKRKLTGFIPSMKSVAIFALGGVATVAGILAFEEI